MPSRIVPAVEECLDVLGPGATGVVVSHGAALKRAVAGLLGWDPSVLRSLAGLDNCRWATVVSGPRHVRRLLEYGGGACAPLEPTG
jgi:probable phosphoglycerate mutase